MIGLRIGICAQAPLELSSPFLIKGGSDHVENDVPLAGRNGDSRIAQTIEINRGLPRFQVGLLFDNSSSSNRSFLANSMTAASTDMPGKHSLAHLNGFENSYISTDVPNVLNDEEPLIVA